MKIKPLSDHVFLESFEEEKKTKSGIVLPDTAEKERPQKGKVVAAGPGKLNNEGKIIPMSVKKGDVVLFSKYGPNETKVDGKEYLTAREDDIIAILE